MSERKITFGEEKSDKGHRTEPVPRVVDKEVLVEQKKPEVEAADSASKTIDSEQVK